jgi:hypothetical protein
MRYNMVRTVETVMDSDTKRYENPRAEMMRLRHLYRDCILRGRVKLPPGALKPLVGPDCAYHLYKYSDESKKHG